MKEVTDKWPGATVETRYGCFYGVYAMRNGRIVRLSDSGLSLTSEEAWEKAKAFVEKRKATRRPKGKYW